MKKILFLLLIGNTTCLHAQIFTPPLTTTVTVHFTNQSQKPVSVVFAYYGKEGDWTGWSTQGYWSIDPGETKQIVLPTGNNTIYYHIVTTWGNFSGTFEFAVPGALSDHSAFTIKNADRAYQISKYVGGKFRKVSVSGSPHGGHEATIIFVN